MNLSKNPVMIFCPDPISNNIIEPDDILDIYSVDSADSHDSSDIEEVQLPNPIEIIESAKIQAAQMLEQAEQEINAKREAFELEKANVISAEKQRAYDIGLLEGAEQKAKDIEEAIASISSQIDEIKANFNEFMDEQKSDLITLVLEVTEKILAKRLENDDYIMIPIIQKALRDVKLKSHCSISVSQEAITLLAFLKKELINANDTNSAMFDIVAKDMPLDFCVLEIDEELLDVSISTQFENLGNFLKHNS